MCWHELFVLSPAGYFILVENGTIENVNDRGNTLLGIDKQSLIGKLFSEFLKTDQDKDSFHLHKIAAISGRQLERMECEVKKNPGLFFCLYQIKVNAG